MELLLMEQGVSSVKESSHAVVLEFGSEEAATRFLRPRLDALAGARTVRDSAVLPLRPGQTALSLLSALLSSPETVH
jgi:hypothetical protein